jgi:hypothetical protein
MPRAFTFVAIACALFLRVWVPAGWMPASGGGAFAIEPCAAASAMPMSQANPAHHGSSENGQHNGDCSFAPHHAGIAGPPETAGIVAPLLAAAAAPQHFSASAFATAPPALPPPATGPPAIS